MKGVVSEKSLSLACTFWMTRGGVGAPRSAMVTWPSFTSSTPMERLGIELCVSGLLARLLELPRLA